ncbi:late competence development ComFB family protein [Mitsuokella sp. oral taxon 131]|uniref:late competence development ComFB family protein n=1 Tax=Mitsuokella sp. oral taxon 131 TaxID=1321780 RepID=UPI0003AE2B03|nr:late competence development ComFB family protein [Mitsuokella sp. oral taxon 131]ERL05106.1 hypothetical protein HMPREF1985_00859 [Mitsuokella sp. oral taxon 131 str. W9106]
MQGLTNYMEEVVERNLDTIMAKFPNCCKCEECRRDIAALALNNLPPRYISSFKGDIFARVNEMEVQHLVEVIQQIAQAIKIVTAHPRHKVKSEAEDAAK